MFIIPRLRECLEVFYFDIQKPHSIFSINWQRRKPLMSVAYGAAAIPIRIIRNIRLSVRAVQFRQFLYGECRSILLLAFR